jgi:hypothetical protein
MARVLRRLTMLRKDRNLPLDGLPDPDGDWGGDLARRDAEVRLAEAEARADRLRAEAGHGGPGGGAVRDAEAAVSSRLDTGAGDTPEVADLTKAASDAGGHRPEPTEEVRHLYLRWGQNLPQGQVRSSRACTTRYEAATSSSRARGCSPRPASVVAHASAFGRLSGATG